MGNSQCQESKEEGVGWCCVAERGHSRILSNKPGSMTPRQPEMRGIPQSIAAEGRSYSGPVFASEAQPPELHRHSSLASPADSGTDRSVPSPSSFLRLPSGVTKVFSTHKEEAPVNTYAKDGMDSLRHENKMQREEILRAKNNAHKRMRAIRREKMQAMNDA